MTDETVEISEETAEVCRRELDTLIDKTHEMEPNPLTDDVFHAVDELRDVLDVGE